MSVQVGVKDLHIAVMTTEDTKEAVAVYGPNTSVAESISINFQPQSDNSVLFADDAASETESSNGPINLSVNTKDLPLKVRAMLLGSSYDEVKGVFTHKATDKIPYIALSFRSKRADGSYRYIQLYKGKATQPKENFQSKTNTTSFNTPTIEFQFIRRIHDEVDYRFADEPTFTGGATFFDDVFEPAAA